jgi:hypothetical protein
MLGVTMPRKQTPPMMAVVMLPESEDGKQRPKDLREIRA